MVTLLVASCCVALTSRNVNTVTADILTGEGILYNRTSILAEVPVMNQSLRAKMTVQQKQEEIRRGESLCVS